MTIANHSLHQPARVPPARYRCVRARTSAEVDAVMRLRSLVFRGGRADDGDIFDARARHIAVRSEDGRTIGACRIFVMRTLKDVHQCYSARFYDLSALEGRSFPMVELGRVCIDRDHGNDPNVLRLLWGAVASVVSALDAALVFGCSSFPGVDLGRHAATLGWLGRKYPAPTAFGPIPALTGAITLAGLTDVSTHPQAGLPPLLRGYLSMGGWVGDGAVLDTDLGTVHVFTALEVANVPAARVRSLRALANLCSL